MNSGPATEPLSYEWKANCHVAQAGEKHPNPLLNSRPLDVHKQADFPAMSELTEDLSEKLLRGARGTGFRKRKNALRLVLTDLLASYREDPAQYIAYSRDKNKYRLATRYNELHIKYRPLIHVIDALAKDGLIETHNGHTAMKGYSQGHMARMRATPTLHAIFASSDELLTEQIQNHSEFECVKLRDSSKQDIDYEDTDHTIQMRELIRTYQGRLNRSHLHIDQTGNPDTGPVRYADTRVFRVFNDGRWDHGGRFYGGWWQQIPSGFRNRIRIDSEPTVELDFKGLHAAMAYALIGIDYFRDFADDPYELVEFQGDRKYRQLCKFSLLAMFNASSRDLAIRGIQKEINFNPRQYPRKPNLDELLRILEAKHDAISQFFYSGIGVKLQFIDSEVAASVIGKMTESECPVLCIHDSFICSVRYEEFLRSLMVQSLNNELVSRGHPSVQIEISKTPFFQGESNQPMS